MGKISAYVLEEAVEAIRMVGVTARVAASNITKAFTTAIEANKAYETVRKWETQQSIARQIQKLSRGYSLEFLAGFSENALYEFLMRLREVR